MLSFRTMKNSLEEYQNQRSKAEDSLNRSAQLQQLVAQMEASLLMRENQKVKEKTQNK